MVEESGSVAIEGVHEPDAHLGAVKEAGIYLVYTFHAGQPIDIHAVAHRLLRSGVAETVYSAAMPEVRVAPRYGGLNGLLQRTNAVCEYLSGSITVRAGLRLWLKYPRSGGSLRPLIWMFAKLRARVRFYRLAKLLRLPAGHKTDDVNIDDDDYGDDPIKMAEELIEQMEVVKKGVVESVARAQVVGAVQVEMDRRLLRPGYWMTEPYLRLGLRSSRHRFVPDPGEPPLADLDPETTDRTEVREPAEFMTHEPDPPHEPAESTASDGDDEGWVEIEALALLHRTGVVQVMLRVPLPDNLSTKNLVGRVSSKPRNIAASILPEPILEPIQLANLDRPLSGRWQPQVAEGVRWREFKFDEPASLDDLFNLYFAAFDHAMPQTGPNWMCYPVLVADGVTCGCSPEEWQVRHRTELAAVMFQNNNAARFKPALIDDVLQDVSHLNDMMVLLNEARGVVIRWGEDRTLNWADDLSTLIPIEQALLQRGQLASLESQFAQAAAKPRRLEVLEEAIITGLDEYRSSQINPGDAQILVDRILERSRALTGYSRLVDSVNQLHQRVTSADTKRSARQANLLAFLAVLVAVALGLPAIKQSIEIANSVPENSSLAPTTKPLILLGEQGSAGVWAAFLALVALAVGTWALSAFVRRGRRTRYRRRYAGRAWEIPLEITLADSEEKPGRSGSSVPAERSAGKPDGLDG